MISQVDFLTWFRKGLDEKAEHPRFSQPLSWPMTIHRQTALRTRVGVARLGHPWIDATEAHLRWDDRGTAVAFWRPHPHAGVEPKVYLRFAAVVEANHPLLGDWSRKNPWANPRTVLRLADAAFPPVEITVWVDPEFTAPEDSLVSILQRPYSKDSGDTNIRAARWTRALEKLKLNPQGWLDHCTRARTTAEAAVIAQSKLAELIGQRLERHATTYREMNDQLLSRREAMSHRQEERKQLDRDLQRNAALHQAIQTSVRKIQVRFDSVAAVILSREAFR